VLATHELPAYSPLSARHLIVAAGRRAARGGVLLDEACQLLSRGFGADDVMLVDSGRSALQLAIALSLPERGDRVVAIPAFQCFEVASAAVGTGCRIAPYDVDPETLQPRLDSLEQALADGATSIVIAPLYGLPVAWSPIETLAARHGAILVEDAAQSHGAAWAGRPVGTFGALSVLSFGRGKGWTGGGGGALLIRSTALAERARAISVAPASGRTELRTAATSFLQLLFGRPHLYGIPASVPRLGLGETRYHHPSPPAAAHPYSLALLMETRAASLREAEVRRRNAFDWSEALPPAIMSGVPRVVPEGVCGYLRYPVCLPESAVAEASADIARRAGIARSYPLTLAELPAVMPRLLAPARAYPGAHTLSRRVVTLPTHSRLTRAARDAILALATSWVRTPLRTRRETPV